MASDWYPVSHSKVEDSYRIPLGFKADGSPNVVDVAKPSGPLKIETVSILASAREFSQSATLGLFGAAEVKNSVSSKLFLEEVFAWDEVVLPPSSTSPALGVRWGVGYRLMVTVTSLSADFELSLASIAAATELGMASASFSIIGHGLSDPKLLKSLPEIGRLDRERLAQIDALQQALTESLAQMTDAEKTKWAVPVHVLLKEPPISGYPMSDARAADVTLQFMSFPKRYTQDRAVEKAKEANIDPVIVEHLYKMAAVPSGKKPEKQHRQVLKTLLGRD